MRIVAETQLGSHIVVKNFEGCVVKRVKSFDTETKQAELYACVELECNSARTSMCYYPDKLILGEDKTGKVPTFKCILYDCKAYDKKTGKEIK